MKVFSLFSVILYLESSLHFHVQSFSHPSAGTNIRNSVPALSRVSSTKRTFNTSIRNQSQVSSTIRYSSQSTTSNTDPPPSKCPVTKFSNRVSNFLSLLDKYALKRLLRIAHHAPALMSLAYFGLISTASMMGPAHPMSTTAQATLSSVLTQTVGPTTNAAFSQMFPTFVTPANFVFLIWPIISILQILTVTLSAIYPLNDEFLSPSDLSSLTISNLCASAWLLVSSNASVGNLPIGSFLVLPLVPLFSAFSLRNKPKHILPAYQMLSSFTTLASFLAFSVELQYGGRIPLIGKVSSEVSANIFMLLYSVASLAVMEKSGVKRLVNFGALSGIVYKRVMSAFSTGVALSGGGVLGLLLSVSFWSTIGCWYWSWTELLPKRKKA